MGKEPSHTHRFIYLLAIAQRRMETWAQAQDGGLTQSQAGLLFLLDREDGMVIGDLAQALGVKRAGISGLIDRMEVARLVTRAADPKDGRVVRLYLTDQGRHACGVAKQLVAQMTERMTHGFEPEELAIVARWLGHIDHVFGG